MVKPATTKQIALIKQLKPDSADISLNSFEASKLIGRLIQSKGQSGNLLGIEKQINEPRLGMAMKECYKIWTRWGNRDFLFGDRRIRFIKEAILTYYLFTEIENRLRNNFYKGEKYIEELAPDWIP